MTVVRLLGCVIVEPQNKLIKEILYCIRHTLRPGSFYLSRVNSCERIQEVPGSIAHNQ